MTTWVAFFRGINVGGRNLLPMKELVAHLEKLGLCKIRTYIQSGNVVFQCGDATASQLASQICRAVSKSYKFVPQVLVLSAADLERAAAENPFQDAESRPKWLHLFFLAESPRSPNLDALIRIKAGNEEFALKGRIFYLLAPDGIGRSKLAAKVEKCLGVEATARNWRTVSKLLEMAANSQKDSAS